jgi:hypothetical protein
MFLIRSSPGIRSDSLQGSLYFFDFCLKRRNAQLNFRYSHELAPRYDLFRRAVPSTA